MRTLAWIVEALHKLGCEADGGMMSNKTCCLCGGSYTRIGNNPYPLYAGVGRCCDACNEVVIAACIDPTTVMEELERIEAAIKRMPNDMALAALCAARGPGMWAQRQYEREQFATPSQQVHN